MDWITFVGLFSIPACAAVAYAVKQANAAKADLAAFKTEVAKTYVSSRILENFEKRIMHELEKIGGRLDKLYREGPHN